MVRRRLAPAQTPRRVVDRLNAELNKAFNDPAFRDQFAMQGVQFVGGSPTTSARSCGPRRSAGARSSNRPG